MSAKRVLQLLRAFVWLRWRMVVNGLRGGRRRDALEQVSRVGAVIGTVALAVIVVPSALILGALALVGGWVLGTGGDLGWLFLHGARVVPAVALIALLVTPAARSAQGLTAEFARYALLPIPRRLLHAVELVAALADPWLAVLAPAVLLLPVGMLAAGSVAGAAAALVAGALLLFALGSFATLSSSVFSLIFRSRRRGELVFLVLTLALSCAAFIPMLMERWSGGHGDPRHARRAEQEAAPERGPEFPIWIRPLPSELYGKTIASASDGDAGGAVGAIGGLLVAGAALYALSWAAYRRLLESPGITSSRAASRAPSRWTADALRLPAAGPRVSAVAVAQIRTVLRTVPGKMAVLFTPVSVAILGVAFLRLGVVTPVGAASAATGPGLALVCGVFSLLSLNSLMVNQFTIDGSGLMLEFLVPLSDEDLIKGKALGGAALLVISLLLGGACSVFVGGRSHLVLWPAALLAVLSAYLLMASPAAALSAVLPKKVDLGRLGRAARPHQAAALAGAFLTGLTLLPPIGLGLLGLLVFHRPALAFVFVAVWTAASAAVVAALVRPLAGLLRARRENLVLVTQ